MNPIKRTKTLSTDVDAAYVHTNGKQKIPTIDQCEELIFNTDHWWCDINGVGGRKFVNK